MIVKTDWAKVNSIVDAKMESLIDRFTARVVEEAKRNAHVVTGELRDSIRVMVRSKLYAEVGTDVPQGLFEEFGTSLHPPHPWLEPAIRTAISEGIGK